MIALEGVANEIIGVKLLHPNGRRCVWRGEWRRGLPCILQLILGQVCNLARDLVADFTTSFFGNIAYLPISRPSPGQALWFWVVGVPRHHVPVRVRDDVAQVCVVDPGRDTARA